MNIDVSSDIKEMFKSLLLRNRMPQAVIIEGGTEEQRKDASDFLAIWAVCSADDNKKPCGECSNCYKAINDSHGDIFIPQPEGKTKIISIKNLRDNILPELSIIPNEANAKVFIFENADKTLREDTQNTLLKSIEEPPQNLLFIFTVESANSLLSTIRSRSQIFTLKADETIDEDINSIAREILSGILDVKESTLLFATADITSKDMIKEIMPVVARYLSKSLSVSVGSTNDDELINNLGKKIKRNKIINLIEACDDIISKANTNINLNILNTYICSTFRRIAWQK